VSASDRRDALNAHKFRPLLRRNLAALTALFLFSLVAVCGFVASRAQSPSPQDESDKKESEIETRLAANVPIKM
jgi:hypothetical protein